MNDDLKLLKSRTTSRLKFGVCIKCFFTDLYKEKTNNFIELYVQGVQRNMTVGEQFRMSASIIS